MRLKQAHKSRKHDWNRPFQAATRIKWKLNPNTLTYSVPERHSAPFLGEMAVYSLWVECFRDFSRFFKCIYFSRSGYVCTAPVWNIGPNPVKYGVFGKNFWKSIQMTPWTRRGDEKSIEKGLFRIPRENREKQPKNDLRRCFSSDASKWSRRVRFEYASNLFVQ